MTKIFTRVAVLGIAGLVMSALPATVSAATPEASFEEETLTTENTRPRLSGEAEDVRGVRLVIEDENGKRVFRSRETRVRDGEWSIRVTKRLKNGSYEATLIGPKSTKYQVLATDTLTIGEEEKARPAKKAGTVYMTSLPLLAGGSERAGAAVPVAYIKVGNPSKETVSIEGFTLKQNGLAPTSVISKFSTSDDKGGSRTTVDASFKNGEAYVPLAATLKPGEVRIYTLKAHFAANLGSAIGKTVMLDVVGAETSAKNSSKFPIRGTTWTLIR